MSIDQAPVSVERLAAALVKMAQIAALDPRALPIYERLEGEFEAAQEKKSVLERAKAIASRANLATIIATSPSVAIR